VAIGERGGGKEYPEEESDGYFPICGRGGNSEERRGHPQSKEPAGALRQGRKGKLGDRKGGFLEDH